MALPAHWCLTLRPDWDSGQLDGVWIPHESCGNHLHFLLANTLGSAVPTPGGLGAVEAVLSVAFTAVGIPSSIAVSATLVYRIAFYWLRIPSVRWP